MATRQRRRRANVPPAGAQPPAAFARTQIARTGAAQRSAGRDHDRFVLTARDVVVDPPAPLFTSVSVSGALTLSDLILQGESFGSSSVTDFAFDFGGIKATLADARADIFPGPVQVFGTRSLDGKSFSVFDLRFGLPPSVKGCGFVCAGQIVINSPIGPADPSNFIALDDPAGDTLSVISSFTPSFSRLAASVPEPATWTMLLMGVFGLGGVPRHARSRDQSADRPSTGVSG